MKLSRKIAALGLTAVLSLTISASAWAHDGWSQTHTPIIAQGEVSYVELLFGNHSNDHKSYRITGQWSTDSTNVFVTTPAGKKVDITSTLYYTGEAATETEPAVNNGFIATFSSSMAGAYIVSVEGDSVFKHGDIASRTLRSAKSFVAVADIPTVGRVQALKGFARPVSLDRAELVPQFNPAAVKPGQQVAVQLILKGQPLADTEVSLIRRSNSEAELLTTDADGRIAFTTGPADYYLLRAKPSTDENKEGEYNTTNYEATMTFAVQNGKVKLAEEQANPVPALYVNGKRVGDAGAEVRQGKTYVDADFIREHIDPGYKGEGRIGLRSELAAYHAAIEYLPQAGGSRAAIWIYTTES